MSPLPYALRTGAWWAVSLFSLLPVVSGAPEASDTIEVPSDFPRLARQTAEEARAWRGDAWLLRIEVDRNHANDLAPGYSMFFHFFSHEEGKSLVLSRGALRTAVHEA
jgi:hypothetical protein